MEACDLAKVTHATVMGWRKHDPEFADIELNRLAELQRNTAGDVMMMEFDRNFRLALNLDFQVLYKAACDVDTLSKNEMDVLKSARPHYTPKGRIDLEQAMKDPEERSQGDLNITVHVDGKEVTAREAKLAGLQALLNRFELNKAMAELAEPAIEGEFKEVPSEV